MFAQLFSALKQSTHLIFPHNCEGCGTDVLGEEHLLCSQCIHQLPKTSFEYAADNIVEKIFYGRMKVDNATAGFYFTKDSLLQHLIFELKYRGNKNIGIYLGNLLGTQLSASKRFENVDLIMPIPLNTKREFKRGYNQALAICEGVASVFKKPILKDGVIRILSTETQTHQDRIHRLENMQNVFALQDAHAIKGKHILLVDDVITTGATIEACGSVILKGTDTKLSIATLACTI